MRRKIKAIPLEEAIAELEEEAQKTEEVPGSFGPVTSLPEVSRSVDRQIHIVTSGFRHH